MPPIISGTSTQRIIRTVLLTCLVIGFACTYLWDGYIGYPRRNALDLAGALGLDPSVTATPSYQLTAPQAGEIAERIKKNERITMTELNTMIGPPAFQQEGKVFFLGPGGHLRVQAEQDRVVGAEWVTGAKSETDLKWQRMIGLLLGLFGVGCVVQLVRVFTFCLAVTDQVLWIGRRRVIPLIAITAVRAPDFAKTGRVEFEYTRSGGYERIRVDDYVVKELRAIVAAVCERRGLSNPLPNEG